MDRRKFLKYSSLGLIGSGLALSPISCIDVSQDDKTKPEEQEKESKNAEQKVEYRKLGRTGLAVATIGFGAMRTSEPGVIQKAFDQGVNYLDTAHCYAGGENEKVVGRALAGYREKVIVATKVHIAPREKMIASVEDSLKSLHTDYIDIIQLHALNSSDQVNNEEAIAALTRLKQNGKVRFTGVTTHENQSGVLDATRKNRFYDVVLVSYNFKNTAPELERAIREAASAGLGIVAMKTQAGGYQTEEMKGLSPHQAALKWVLQNKGVATTIPSMVNMSQVDENIAVMGVKMSAREWSILEHYSQAIDNIYCRMCRNCEGTCPRGVAVREINRFLMYAEGYADLALGREHYRKLAKNVSASQCFDCLQCTVNCTNGLNVAEKMRQARTILA